MSQAGGTVSVRGQVGRLAAIAKIAPEERVLAGSVNGVLHALAGLTLAVFLVLPGTPRHHVEALLIAAVLALVWGACCLLLIDWRSVPDWLFHATTLLAFGGVAVSVASSGGVRLCGST
jgi:hypothetical protein